MLMSTSLQTQCCNCYHVGEHYLNTDSIIQNIDNFSIIGTETDGVINSTIRCTSTAGLSIVNCSNVSLANLRIKDCANDYNSLVNVFTSWYAGCFEKVGLFLLNSWFVSIINIHLIQDQEMLTCGIKTLNLLGRSMLNNTITNCLELYFDAVAVDNTTDLLNELYIDNFQREKHDTMPSIAIFLSHPVYNVNIILINSSFRDIQTFLLICDKFLGHSSITISNCNLTMVNDKYVHGMVWFYFEDCINLFSNASNEVRLIECQFLNITTENIGKLLYMYIDIIHYSQDSWLSHWTNQVVLLLIVYLKIFRT